MCSSRRHVGAHGTPVGRAARVDLRPTSTRSRSGDSASVVAAFRRGLRPGRRLRGIAHRWRTQYRSRERYGRRTTASTARLPRYWRSRSETSLPPPVGLPVHPASSAAAASAPLRTGAGAPCRRAVPTRRATDRARSSPRRVSMLRPVSRSPMGSGHGR